MINSLTYLHRTQIVAQLTQEQQVTERHHRGNCKQTFGYQSRIQEVPVLSFQVLLIVEANADVGSHPEHEGQHKQAAFEHLVDVPPDTEEPFGS